MKLSVKWLAGLAVLALAVVAVVGSTSATKAQTAGSIFVVNEWSNITNQSPAPDGRTARSTVYATIDDGERLIETDANLIRVVIVDELLDETVTASATTVDVDNDQDGQEAGGSEDDTFGGAAGSTRTIFLTGQDDEPIAGSLANIKIFDDAVPPVDRVADNTFTVNSSFFAGSPGNDPWISVTRQSGSGAITISSIEYETSTTDEVEVTVTSELETTGVTLTATETGLSTGIFEGFVRLVPSGSTTAAGTPGDTPGTAATMRTNVGPVTVEFEDNADVTRQTTVLVDTSAPVGTISGPADGSATQNRTPTFSGSISESGAGLDISTIQVAYDSSDDATNLTPVVDTADGDLASSAVTLSVNTTGAIDGDTAFSFSQIPSVLLPNASIDQPDHTVDWVIKANDLAGNIGLSDADASEDDIQLPSVKIDTVFPRFTGTPPGTGPDHKTGLANSSTGEVAARNSLRVVFNDQLQNVQASDFTVTLDSGAVVVPTNVTVVNDVSDITPALSGAAGSAVYLTFSNDLVSNETPRVDLQDTISDLAGNFTGQGTVTSVTDGIAPSLTVTLSGGSGTGSGSEDSSNLTADDMVIEIESDEPLSGAPAVRVFSEDDESTPETTPNALAQGTNRWTATYSPGSPNPDGMRAVEIEGGDVAGNTETVGGNDASVSGTPNFRLDTELADPVLTVGGGSAITDQTRPSIVIDFAAGTEASTVNQPTVQLDGTDITDDVVASSDGQRFFYIPPTDLSMGEHELLIEAGDVSDVAGNDNDGDITLTLMIQERSMFELDVFAGWNAMSFPSNPIDPDINSVFTNAGHDAVLGFDSGVPGQWRVAVRDTVSGLLEPATENGLTSVRTTQAYWVHSLNFESVEALLDGEVLPAAGSPPGIITIPTVLGFNAVPIVDTSRKQTTGPSEVLERQVPSGPPVAVTVSTYLGAVNEGRVYRWNPEILSFVLLTGSTAVNTGDVLFVEVLGDANGNPSPIFP